MKNIDVFMAKLKPTSVVAVATAFAFASILAALASPVAANTDPTAEEVVVPLWSFDGHTDKNNDVAVTPDGSHIYTASRDDTARKLDQDGNEDESWRYEDYGNSLNTVAVDSTGSAYAAGSSSIAEVHKIDQNGDVSWTSASLDTWVNALAIDEANNHIYVGLGATGSDAGKIVRLDTTDGSRGTWEFDGFGGAAIGALAHDATDDKIYAVGFDGNAKQIDIAAETEDWNHEDDASQLYTLALNNDASRMYVGGTATITELDTTDGSVVTSDFGVDLFDSVRSLAVDSADNVYAGDTTGLLGQFDASGNTLSSVQLHDGWNESIAIDNDDFIYVANGLLNESDAFIYKIDFDNTEVRYSFDNVTAGLDVRDANTNESLVLGEGYTTVTAPTLWVGLDDDTPIATAPVAITGSSDARDFSGVTADSDSDTNKSFLSGIQTLTGIEGGVIDFALYVPKAAADDQVHICPGASTLAEVTVDCTDVEVYNENDDNVSVSVIDDQAYWVVGGLAGTGGVSVQSEAEEDTETAPGLPDTGVGVATGSGSGSGGAEANALATASSLAGFALAASGAYLVRRFDY